MNAIPKIKPWRSAKYRAWVKSQPCVVCGVSADHAHHEQEPGKGTLAGKCGDDRTVSLCACHHHERHQKGRSIWQRWGIDIEATISRLRDRWEG